jgi:hypothetical protein
MAVFKAPKITTTQRESLILDVSEVVFDLDGSIFYGGDGVTIGGFPIGQGVQNSIAPQIITLTQTDIDNKYVVLNTIPLVPEALAIIPVGGPEQLYEIDYEIIGNILSWNGLGLDGFLNDTDKLIVRY